MFKWIVKTKAHLLPLKFKGKKKNVKTNNYFKLLAEKMYPFSGYLAHETNFNFFFEIIISVDKEKLCSRLDYVIVANMAFLP